MHDLDRPQGRMQMETEAFEFPGEHEALGEAEYQPEVLPEAEVQELAAELLSVSNEQELNYFLGNLIKRAGRFVGNVVRSPIGQALGGVLKNVARQALPMAGTALGNLVAPGIGGAIGGQLASAAGSAFGLELEGLSQEDQEFEVAKQFVRLAADATKTASAAPPSANPSAVARQALSQAAQKFAPGLLSEFDGGVATPYAGGVAAPYGGGLMTGRWVRRGRRIIIYGV